MFDGSPVTATHSTSSSGNLPWKDEEGGNCVNCLAVVKMCKVQINGCGKKQC